MNDDYCLRFRPTSYRKIKQFAYDKQLDMDKICEVMIEKHLPIERIHEVQRYNIPTRNYDDEKQLKVMKKSELRKREKQKLIDEYIKKKKQLKEMDDSPLYYTNTKTGESRFITKPKISYEIGYLEDEIEKLEQKIPQKDLKIINRDEIRKMKEEWKEMKKEWKEDIEDIEEESEKLD